MADIVLVKAGETPTGERELMVLRNFLFGTVDGLDEKSRTNWRRLWNWLLRCEAGEVAKVSVQRTRHGPFHRRHMLIESRVFNGQERFSEFDQFRNWLKVGAGHVDWFPGPRGGVVPIPKSISYSSLEEVDMRSFHDSAMAFLRTPHAIKALWPHLPDAQRDEAIHTILSEFNE